MEILLERLGRNCYVELCPTYYARNRSLAVLLYDKSSKEPDSALTVCLDDAPGLNKAYIDVNNQGSDIIQQLVANGLGEPTGRMRTSGRIEYPEFQFNGKILLECMTDSYGEYLEWYRALREDEEYLLPNCKKCHKQFPFIVKRSAAE